MRLADFILANIEPILVEWEAFARSIWRGIPTDPITLRDHAKEMLIATAAGMSSDQSSSEQSDESKGKGISTDEGVRVKAASKIHARDRVRSGFDLQAIVAEYRALRASVIRLWRASDPEALRRDLSDLQRFNESIDQGLAEAARSYSEQVDRSRQMFLAILGHDLRNPLNSISMSAQLLASAVHDDADSSRVATQITSGAHVMAKLIGDLLDFTAAGLGGAMPLEKAAMDLRPLCQNVVDEMRTASPKHTLRFSPHGDLNGQWDAGRLRQMISNLVGNAIQHGVETGPVDFTVSAEGDEVMLTVHNGGPPIPREALPTIFDPLTRGSSLELKKQRRPGSIGLGLYIAREVVTAHGGTIDVKSTIEDGTTFTVHLPRHAPTT